MNSLQFYNYDATHMEKRIRDKPLHILEALQRMLLHQAKTDQDEGSSAIHTNRRPPKNNWKLYDSQFRSATDLKAKGIHFKPSSPSLTDISFFSFFTHGSLHLPLFRITSNNSDILSNLMAYEITSNGTTELGIIRYVNFMKTLLRKAEDMTLLREKGVLYSTLASDEEVVRLFQDTDTYGASNNRGLYDIRMRIEEHCNDWRKTWLAELINAYFRSPLTAIGLFAVAFILVLTFQTFYTINPKYVNAAP